MNEPLPVPYRNSVIAASALAVTAGHGCLCDACVEARTSAYAGVEEGRVLTLPEAVILGLDLEGLRRADSDRPGRALTAAP